MTGYVPPGARTEEVSDTTLPRGLRCEEIRISSDNGHSLCGVTVSTSEASRNAQKSTNNLTLTEDPETLFFYLQGSSLATPKEHSLNIVTS